MAITTASAATIEQLNARTAALASGAEGHAAYLAALSAARELGFTDAAPEISAASECRALANSRGEHVNLWVDGRTSQRVEEGGIGFDDQLDWYDEYLEAGEAVGAE